MLVIMMSPSISNTKPKMATTCEPKKENIKHQQTKKKTKKHLETPEIVKLRAISRYISSYNGTGCGFFNQV